MKFRAFIPLFAAFVLSSCDAPPKTPPPPTPVAVPAVPPPKVVEVVVSKKVELDPAKLREMDSAIEQTVADGKTPGGVLWVEHRGVNYHRAYGSRAIVPAREAMTEDTIFDAASLSKVLGTAPSLMLLIERGKVKLDEPVWSYIPQFKSEGKDAITIRHLLTHTSGLRAGLSRAEPWSGWDKAIEMACAEKPLNPAGTFFRYSDINFIVLGEVIQRVSGKKLNEFAKQEIWQPLKMNETTYLPDESLRSRIAPTEQLKEELLRGVVHDPTSRRMGGVAGHAGVFTTASDVARYARMMLNGGELDGVRVLKPESVKLMTSVQSPPDVAARRGLGWDIDTGYSRPRGKKFPLGSFGHTGFTGTCVWIDPFSETFWIFMSNRVHPDGKGNILPLQAQLGTLAAECVTDFDFEHVSGALKPLTIEATPVLNGIDVLVKQDFAPLKGLRIGLITNQTGTDLKRTPTIDLLKNAKGIELKVLFSPEHGIRGIADEKVGDSVDEKTGLPIFSLYGDSRKPKPDQLRDLDALVFDIQDIGCRFYTYISTMGLAMEAASEAKLKFFVLDRANPINGVGIEGPVASDGGFTAFHPIPVRHGMTVGELAQLFASEKHLTLNLSVIKVENWSREMFFDHTGQPWTNPSPNMRSLTEALLYPGIGLLETALSVGRGTDTPFEVIGAPYIDDVKLAGALNAAGLAGVRFVPVRFTPNASVYKGKTCGGVNIILTDRERLAPVDVGIVIGQTLSKLYPQDFDVSKMNALLKHPETIEAIKAGKSLSDIRKIWQDGLDEFKKRRKAALIYK